VAWRTYTPDGRTLEIEFTDGNWIASCEDGRGVGATAAEAILRAITDAPTPIGASIGVLATWVGEQSSRLERERKESEQG
jgi:hypothetical protein